MGFFFDNEDRTWRNILTRSLLVIVSTILIVWALPKKASSSFDFDTNIGQPWKGNTVIAKFRFSILKSDEAIASEREELLKNFQPYYKVDKNVSKRAVEEFDKAFTKENAGDLYAHKSHLYRLLCQLYDKRIMDGREYAQLTADTIMIINEDNSKSASPVEKSNILTPIQAYENIFVDTDLTKLRDQLSRFDLNKYIRPNLIYDVALSEAVKEEIANKVIVSTGVVEKGEKIVDTGDKVTEDTYMKLQSLKKEMESRSQNKQETYILLIGQLITVLMLIILFTCYLIIFRSNYFSKPRHILMLFSMITLFPIMYSILVKHPVLNAYIIPFAMVPMLTRVFLDSRTAFITHTIIILISSIAISYRFEFIVIEMVAGLTAIYALNDMSKRAHLFQAAFFVTICSAISYYAIQLIQNDQLVPADPLFYMVFVSNGILLLLAYPLMFVIEKLFGFTSVITLFELSDSSRGLLRQLSEVAPGTFTHSTTVGNLAYEIANKIGANGLLVRTGALYHDIGKMVNPVFFTENQANVNPHDNLTEKESAAIITSHVLEGQKLAEKYNLPATIKDFILTHHGLGVAKYFYLKYQNAHPDEKVDKDLFSYPGPNPFTREQAILMMADSVEAASRSIKEYNEENIRTLVNRIIDSQVNEGYFTECPITFLDIATAKQVLIERLKSIYHTRIQYPGQNERETITEERTIRFRRNKNKKKRKG